MLCGTAISEHHQALCIVNSKRAARELYDLLPCEGRFHLSTRMLPEDRRLALDEIRQRLKDGLLAVLRPLPW